MQSPLEGRRLEGVVADLPRRGRDMLLGVDADGVGCGQDDGRGEDQDA